MEGTFHNIIKAIYDKIIPNGEKLKPFTIKSVMRQRCLLSPLIQYVFEIPSQSNETGARSNKGFK
jgi:hypothetical protein